MFIAINENESWCLDDNIKAHIPNPDKLNRYEVKPVTATGIFGTIAGSGFAYTNVKWSINGYIYGNMPMMAMRRGDRVPWYVATLGDFNNAHTPHWHGTPSWWPASALTCYRLSPRKWSRPTWCPTQTASGSITATSATICWPA